MAAGDHPLVWNCPPRPAAMAEDWKAPHVHNRYADARSNGRRAGGGHGAYARSQYGDANGYAAYNGYGGVQYPPQNGYAAWAPYAYPGAYGERDLNSVYLAEEDYSRAADFQKNFYLESPVVSARSEEEVARYRYEKQITVEPANAPRPVQAFQEAGFPGGRSLLSLIFRELSSGWLSTN